MGLPLKNLCLASFGLIGLLSSCYQPLEVQYTASTPKNNRGSSGGGNANLQEPVSTSQNSCVGSTSSPLSKVTRAYHAVAGVSADLLSLDIYGLRNSNTDCLRPVVIYVHGGGWQNGNKSNVAFKNTGFNSQGFVFVSTNYRLATATSNKHPTQVQDLSRAIAWVRSNIAGYGGDANNISLLGHSAGAHLVSLIATHPSYTQSPGNFLRSDIRCVVSNDTDSYDLSQNAEEGSAGQQDSIATVFGSNPSTLADGSPLNHVQANVGIPRFQVVVRGTNNHKAGGQLFHAELREAGVSSELKDLSSFGFSHEEVNEFIGKPGESVVTSSVMNFIKDCARD
jgi:arylformamidase